MKLKHIFILLVLTFSSVIVLAQDEASAAMEKKDFDKAVQIYDSMLEDGQASYPLFVNLGIAHTQLGNFGKARLAFERALKIEANGKEAKNNIDFVKQQMTDEIIEVEPFFLYRWWQSVALSFSPLTWFLLNIIFLICSLYLLYRYLLDIGRWSRRQLEYGIGIALVCLFLTFFLGNSRKYHLQRTDTAIIMTSSELRIGADEKSDSVCQLEPGHKIIILDQIGDWFKVSKLDKEQGWIRSASFERI